MKISDLLACGTIPEVGMIVYLVSEEDASFVRTSFGKPPTTKTKFKIFCIEMGYQDGLCIGIQNIKTKELTDGAMYYSSRFTTKKPK